MLSKKNTSLEFVIHRDETLRLEDGVQLRSRLWIPKGKGPWPVLLMRQPYGREIASTVTYAHPSWFAKHGFLVIIQDVRGQGASTGDFAGFSQEASDTSETLKWVRSLPECNGKVGTYGFSYQGLTQLLAIPGTSPPDCLAPAMTGFNEHDHWSCEGGAFCWHIGLSWGLQLAAQRVKRLKDYTAWNDIRKSLETGNYLRDGPDLLAKYDPKGMAMKWLNQSQKTTVPWSVHQPLRTWLKKPLLLMGGWWDPHLRGIIDIYHQSLKAGGKPELHIGPATHLQWWEGTHTIQLDFFKKHLQGSQNSNLNSPKHFFWNLTSKQWENSKQPFKDVHSWGLQSKGAACIDREDGKLSYHSKGNGIVQIVHDPWRPVPAIGGHLSLNPGEADRSHIDKRTDVATFTSSPLTKSIYLEGSPLLEVEVFADQKGFDLCVALSIIDEGLNESKQLSTGILRVLGDKALTPLKRKIELFPLFAELKEGTRLRISIAGAAWPAIGINPGNIETPCKAPNPECLVTTIYLKLNESKLQISPLITS